MMTIEQLISWVNENDALCGYADAAYVGIRTQEEPFELGALYHDSHIWVDGEDTGDELDGICCTSLASSSAQKHLDGNYYFGDHIALIIGSGYEWGEDEGEIILHDPQVVYIIK